eukprot:gene23272-biopygen2827
MCFFFDGCAGLHSSTPVDTSCRALGSPPGTPPGGHLLSISGAFWSQNCCGNGLDPSGWWEDAVLRVLRNGRFHSARGVGGTGVCTHSQSEWVGTRAPQTPLPMLLHRLCPPDSGLSYARQTLGGAMPARLWAELCPPDSGRSYARQTLGGAGRSSGDRGGRGFAGAGRGGGPDVVQHLFGLTVDFKRKHTEMVGNSKHSCLE